MVKLFDKVILWNFLIIMAGYPIISFLPLWFNIDDTQIFTIPYRAICFLSAVITIYIGIKIKIYSLINSKQNILYLFLVA